MTARAIVALDEAGTLDVPQAGDTYYCPTDLDIDGTLTVNDINVLKDIFTTDIETVADQDYVLWYDAPYAGKVTMVRTESVSGTCTLTGKVNTTALGGTANSVSSSAQEQSHTTSNTFSKGDKVLYTISSNSSCLNLAAAFYLTRTA